VSINHPFLYSVPTGTWLFDWEHQDSIEVWDGPWDPTDEQSLATWHSLLVEGKRFTGIGGNDAHKVPDVTALPTTVVLSKKLSEAAIIDGVRNHNVYIVRDTG